jgi:hypothetical protein
VNIFIGDMQWVNQFEVLHFYIRYRRTNVLLYNFVNTFAHSPKPDGARCDTQKRMCSNDDNCKCKAD